LKITPQAKYALARRTEEIQDIRFYFRLNSEILVCETAKLIMANSAKIEITGRPVNDK